MSIETNKTYLEAGSFKALKNVADVARQVMIGEDQEKQELQELINIVKSAKYVSEEKKEIIITELSADLLKRAKDKALAKRDADKTTGAGESGKYAGQRQANKFGAGAKRAETGIKSPADAMKYYKEKGKAPSGWRVIDTASGKKVTKE